jgi:hypothetical protein
VIRLAAIVAVTASLLIAAPAAADEPVVTAGGLWMGPAIDRDGDTVLFSSVSRSLDPLAQIDAPEGIYEWRNGRLGRVHQLGRWTVDVTADGTRAVILDQDEGFEGDEHDHVYTFSTTAYAGAERVSVNSDEEPANADSCCSRPTISDDGRYVAFTSTASNLDDDHPFGGAFLRDRLLGTTRGISISHGGVSEATISGDGSTVVFLDDDVLHVHDVATGETRVTDVPATAYLDVDLTGRRVVYNAADDSGLVSSVFVTDLDTGETEQVDVDRDGGPPDSSGFQGSISDDGSRVAFASAAGDLTTDDQSQNVDVFVRDLDADATTLLTRGDGLPSDRPDISGDGRWVAFVSAARNLVPNTRKAPGLDAYLVEVGTGTVRLLSPARDAGLVQLLRGDRVARVGPAPIVNPRVPAGAVAIEPNYVRDGYWIVNGRGELTANRIFGHGDLAGVRLNAPIIDLVASPAGPGYWMLAGDGGVFGFGAARFEGSTGAMRLNQPVVGMAPTPTGRGYWLVARDGGIFSFGDAAFFGSTGAMRLNQPVVGMAATPTGRGYWLVAADGGVFTFGDAAFLGSAGALPLNRPIIGMRETMSGRGYWLFAADGGVFTFGDAFHWGAVVDRDVVDVAVT